MTPITTTAELETFCAKVRGQDFVAVDTEFMRETTYWPKLCLIQAATPDAEAVIDPLTEGLDLEPFLGLLRDASITKVFHAARQDVEIFNILNAMPVSLFDTQVAAMAAGYGEQIAYDALVRNMLKIELDKSSRFTDWARRPLTDNQLTYALADVTHLAALYPRLRTRLEAEGRLAWVADEMTSLCDPTLYDVSPENAWRRLKPRKQTPRYLSVYRAVAEWRERTAQLRDQPRSRILKDDAIDELASQAPTDPGQMDRLRSVPKGFSGSRFGPELLEIIREALRNPEASAPTVERTRAPHNPAAGAVVELLKVLLKARAEDAGVASKLIAT
ncbi:MAG: ribonuclease D, partial [Phenylobacterium sp.]